MAEVGKARARHEADITSADHGDAHQGLRSKLKGEAGMHALTT
jgi:hypothetical protein